MWRLILGLFFHLPETEPEPFPLIDRPGPIRQAIIDAEQRDWEWNEEYQRYGPKRPKAPEIQIVLH